MIVQSGESGLNMFQEGLKYGAGGFSCYSL